MSNSKIDLTTMRAQLVGQQAYENNAWNLWASRVRKLEIAAAFPFVGALLTSYAAKGTGIFAGTAVAKLAGITLVGVSLPLALWVASAVVLLGATAAFGVGLAHYRRGKTATKKLNLLPAAQAA